MRSSEFAAALADSLSEYTARPQSDFDRAVKAARGIITWPDSCSMSDVVVLAREFLKLAGLPEDWHAG